MGKADSSDLEVPPPTSTTSSDDEARKEPARQLATIRQVYSFGAGKRKAVNLTIGFLAAVVSGSFYPIFTVFFAKAFEDLSGSSSNDDFMDGVRRMAWNFMILGGAAFVSMGLQNSCLELAASEMALSLKQTWFDALLRQDMAYFDLKDVSGTASLITSNATKYRRGLGAKLGIGIQFFVTMIGCLGYAFYASWKASLVVLTVLPFIAGSALYLVKATQNQTAHANSSYAEAGSILYEAVSAIRTVLSLNACPVVISKFKSATEKAYTSAVKFVTVVGLSNAAVNCSFVLSFLVLTLYGGYLLYDDVRKTGCDPSGAVSGANNCSVTGMDVFGALMGVWLAAASVPQVSVAVEAFMGARAACYPAIEVINRVVERNDAKDDTMEAPKDDASNGTNGLSLPEYVIDSSSANGKKPSSMRGEIQFQEVSFAYPTRPDVQVFDGLSLDIEPGKTVAIVGPSGSGKSTVVQLIERFYDPTAGSIRIDGIDLRELNVTWLREHIGLVSQEPVLFAKSIRENIAYGCSGATNEQIEAAAKMANAHDFITSFPDGYETQVGDKGAQLSGGQKQRIAIARVLVKAPSVLLLDEATSALDSESELVVQSALDKLLESSNRTTIVIAHRLSTIKNADVIAVVEMGKIVETGNHNELMALEDSRYRQLVEAQSAKREPNSMRRESSGEFDNPQEGIQAAQLVFRDVHFSYPTRPKYNVFQGLNLSVKQGETLALVGPSGCGKSTVVQLVERFYDPDSGAVELDGVNLKDLNVAWLRDQLGLVGQEPTLFNASIAENIKFGNQSADQEQVEAAAKQANAHDFIMSFPDGYDTQVGARATLISGGQKQRIAIARAILKAPKILLLDEATSALDSESEKVVQKALDDLLAAKLQTTIVIAHRLSTIRNADRIAVFHGGIVKEIGTHDELMAKPNGRYKRLQEVQSLENESRAAAQADDQSLMEKESGKKADDSEADHGGSTDEEADKKNAQRARLMAKEDRGHIFVGAIGAMFSGAVYPAWGIVSGYLIELLYRPVLPCEGPNCDERNDNIADDMQDLSFKIAYGWLGVMGAALIGNTLLYYGFGTATERMNKRVRDSAFKSLVRQEVTYFDMRSVGSIASQLQDDAALIHSFSGQPIRVLIVSISSVLVGVVVAFIYMWPFALLSIGTLPFLAFGAEVETKLLLGEDEGGEEETDGNSPGGIAIETLLNMRTVASLTIEETRSKEYATALRNQDPTPVKTSVSKGITPGLGFMIQCLGFALMFWFGGWLLINYPDDYTYRDYNVALFTIFMSLYGFALAFENVVDRDKAKEAARRMFDLIDRESKIDPLSDAGKKGVYVGV